MTSEQHNRILATLSENDEATLAPHLERVELKLNDPLIRPNEPIDYCFFPISALGSLVTVFEDGSTVEAGTVGREGMTGIPVILGACTTPMQTVTQVGGTALRVQAALVRQLFDESERFRAILNRYTHTLFVVASQSAGCNRRHQVEQRLARWLLMSSDGIGSHDIGITQEYLAAMLGVRRAGVTEAALALQRAGLIQYSRGNVKIVDRSRLESAACECYHNVRAEYDRMFAM